MNKSNPLKIRLSSVAQSTGCTLRNQPSSLRLRPQTEAANAITIATAIPNQTLCLSMRAAPLLMQLSICCSAARPHCCCDEVGRGSYQ